MDVGGLGFSRQLTTLDEDLTNYFDISNASSNVFNNINNANLVNSNANVLTSAQLVNQMRSLRKGTHASAPTPSSTSESTCLSFSLTRQYILYDTYRTGSEKKGASMIVGQSPYTSSPDVQTVASTEEIDAELDKVKELFAAGFIQQEDYMTRVLSLNTQKAKAVGN
jgi:hypothetical protein